MKKQAGANTILILIIFLLVLVLGGMGVALTLVRNNQNTQSESEKQSELQKDQDNKEITVEEMKRSIKTAFTNTAQADSFFLIVEDKSQDLYTEIVIEQKGRNSEDLKYAVLLDIGEQKIRAYKEGLYFYVNSEDIWRKTNYNDPEIIDLRRDVENLYNLDLDRFISESDFQETKGFELRRVKTNFNCRMNKAEKCFSYEILSADSVVIEIINGKDLIDSIYIDGENFISYDYSKQVVKLPEEAKKL